MYRKTKSIHTKFVQITSRNFPGISQSTEAIISGNDSTPQVDIFFSLLVFIICDSPYSTFQRSESSQLREGMVCIQCSIVARAKYGIKAFGMSSVYFVFARVSGFVGLFLVCACTCSSPLVCKLVRKNMCHSRMVKQRELEETASFLFVFQSFE